MSLYESLVRPLLFSLDPESAHELGMSAIRCGALRARPFADPRLEQTLMGKRFANPLGLAAGFDKNAVALEQWDDFGFGFVEVGTITAHPQPGNPKPRMFRFPNDGALINRLGFNNEGAEAIAARIAQARPTLPVGINLGKSKITPLEEAARDYQTSYRLLHTYGDYFVVNVSSPNTPGLRQLQDKSALAEIFAALHDVDAAPPLFVKIAPDLTYEAIDEVVEVASKAKLAGMIATNTTLSREGLSESTSEAGGLSGKPLRKRANDVMRHLARSVPEEMLLIGVGGIFTADDLFDRLASGAHLCQMYTGWIYGGPGCVPDILENLVLRMQEEGLRNLEELRAWGRASHR